MGGGGVASRTGPPDLSGTWSDNRPGRGGRALCADIGSGVRLEDSGSRGGMCMDVGAPEWGVWSYMMGCGGMLRSEG